MSNKKKAKIVRIILSIIAVTIAISFYFYFKEKTEFYYNLATEAALSSLFDDFNSYFDTYRMYLVYMMFGSFFPLLIFFPLENLVEAIIYKVKKYLVYSILHLGITLIICLSIYFAYSQWKLDYNAVIIILLVLSLITAPISYIISLGKKHN